MRVLLLGQQSRRILAHLDKAGLTLATRAEDADAAICYGGDGTLLGAERDYPGLPKVPVRKNADDEEDREGRVASLLRRVAQGDVQEMRLPKLRAATRQHHMRAINDILIHNVNVTSAVRYQVEIDGLEHFGEVVGDGLVVATPFGSSAYYRSITNSVIHVGIGLAFNNSTEPVNHLVLDEESRIRVTIARGPAVLAADNNPLQLPLIEGDVVDIRRSGEEAVVWEIDNLLCMDSGNGDQQRRLRWIYPRIRQRRKEPAETEGKTSAVPS